jgi:cell division protease FtsH
MPAPYHGRTEVERRNRPLARIWRTIRRVFLPTVILTLILAALLDAAIMQLLVTGIGFVLQIVLMIGLAIMQFVAIFWFLARSRMYTIYPGAEGVNFDDYRGQPELVEQARQIVTLVKGIRRFEDMGGEPLNGLLLEGPPGTGKTWLAQAISTEAGVPFFFVDASSLQAMFIGVGPMKVMRMYSKARKAANEYGAAIVFIDEIDAIATSRGGVSGGQQQGGMMGGMFGGMASMGLLSTMLVEMSGFSLDHGIRAKIARLRHAVATLPRRILRRPIPPMARPQKRLLTIGATNRITALDPALLRPGRFDKKVRLDAPTMDGRKDILRYYLGKMAHDESIDVDILASDTPGFTPADLKYLLNEALRRALFDGRELMSYSDFRTAMPEHTLGLRQPITNISAQDRKRVAYHEAGHAVAACVFQPTHRIARVSIVRYGESLGHVDHKPIEEQHTLTRDDILNRMCVSLGGRAAEEEIFEVAMTGASNDLNNVRRLLSTLATTGMLNELGTGDQPTPAMLEEMEGIYREQLARTRLALRKNREVMDRIVERLLEKEEIDFDEVQEIFAICGCLLPTAVEEDLEPNSTDPKSEREVVPEEVELPV